MGIVVSQPGVVPVTPPHPTAGESTSGKGEEVARLATSTGLDFIPIVGNLKSLYEAALGHDPVTGEAVEGGWRALALAGVIPGVGNLAKVAKLGKLAKGASTVARAANQGFKHAWIKRELFAELPKLTGEANFQKFKRALKKGTVGPKNEGGIKILEEPRNGMTHELKINGSGHRLFGRVNEKGILVFEKFEPHHF